jgi:crotonobetainyl-CoA:carnitine CoA-transferase CaiB-like acyl-CoA transferase
LLSGYRALDLTDEKGLLCGKTLGDLGVDVIKIEKPGGDSARRIGPFYNDILDPEKSLYWFAYNTNKRGVTLDIENVKGQEIFKKLVATADFVIESSPPGHMARLGLNYEALSRINKRIIMTSITPFGQRGPYSGYKASDIVATALGGLMYITGDRDRPPLRVSADQAYCHAGLQASTGTMIAHHYRELTGEGQHVDVSMQESIVVTLWITLNLWNMTKVIQKREGRQRRRYSIKENVFFHCKDGYVAWELLLGHLGNSTAALVEWMDAEGAAGELMEINWREVDFNKVTQEQWNKWEDSFAEFFLAHTKAELHHEALKRGILLMPVNNIEDIIESRHLKARDFWMNVEHPELGGSFTYPGASYKIRGVPLKKYRRAPLIGEHNQEIFHDEMGLSERELMTLKQDNII